FIEKCKKSKIWDNTLFVFISDHGTAAVNNLDLEDSRMYHIPMILAGGALAVKDTIIPVLGAQYDIIATLLAQMRVGHDKFKFSRDLLQKDAPHFAFSAYSNAAMIMTDKGQTVYRFQDKKLVKGSEGDLLKSFLQVVNNEENPLPKPIK
ncbi:MAG: sulfatase-like hydrolase/transferase, partial [Bacilli bacterium]